MKKLLGIVLICTLLSTMLFSMPMNVSAREVGSDLTELGKSYDEKWSSLGDDLPARESTVIGDVNLDEKITVKDATLVQKFVAGIENITYNGYYNADVNDNGKITVTDATAIQKKVAGLIERFPLEERLYPIEILTLGEEKTMRVLEGYEGEFIFSCEKEARYRLNITGSDMVVLINEDGKSLRSAGKHISYYYDYGIEYVLTPGEYKYVVYGEYNGTEVHVTLEEIPDDKVLFDFTNYIDLPLGSDIPLTDQESVYTIYKITIDGKRDDIGYLDVFVEGNTHIYLYDAKGCFINRKDYLEADRNSFGFAFHLTTEQEIFVVVHRIPDVDESLDLCSLSYDTYTNYYFKDAEALEGEVISKFYYEAGFTEYDDGVYGYKFIPAEDGYYKLSVDTYNPTNSTVHEYYSSISLYDSTVFESGLTESAVWASEAFDTEGTKFTEYLTAGETYYILFAGYTQAGTIDVKFSVSEGTEEEYDLSHQGGYSYITLGDSVDVSFTEPGGYEIFTLYAEEDMDIVICSDGGDPYVGVMNLSGESVLISDNISETDTDFAIRGKLTAGDIYYILVGCSEDTASTTVSVIPYSEYK